MIKNVIPKRHDRDELVTRDQEDQYFSALHRRMDDLFEDFFGSFERGLRRSPFLGLKHHFGAAIPNMDVTESDNEIVVTADLPGMEEKDVEITLDNDLLTIRGDRKEEREEKKKNYYMSERTYGEFHRTIPLPSGVDKDQVKAAFKKGVLKVTLPKLPEAKSDKKKIEITEG